MILYLGGKYAIDIAIEKSKEEQLQQAISDYKQQEVDRIRYNELIEKKTLEYKQDINTLSERIKYTCDEERRLHKAINGLCELRNKNINECAGELKNPCKVEEKGGTETAALASAIMTAEVLPEAVEDIKQYAANIDKNTWGGQCGRFVNDHNKLGRLFADTYESKAEDIKRTVPEDQDIAVMRISDTLENIDTKENTIGHVAFVFLDSNADCIWLLDSNRRGNEQIDFRKICKDDKGRYIDKVYFDDGINYGIIAGFTNGEFTFGDFAHNNYILEKIKDIPTPSNYTANHIIYKAAGFKHEIAWQVVSAVHFAETKGSPRHTESPRSSAGAQGCTQFMPATFAAYKVDGDGDGIASLDSCQDMIFTAANYLSKNYKKSNDMYKAVWQYNHADWYVQRVRGEAEKLGFKF